MTRTGNRQAINLRRRVAMVLIGTTGGGLPAIYGSVIVVGLAIVLLVPAFGRLLRFLPPLVTGTVILIIGLSLLPVAGNWAAGGVGSAEFGGVRRSSAEFGEPKNLASAAFVLAVVLGVQRFAPVFLSRIAVLIGIVVGPGRGRPLRVHGLRPGRHQHAVPLRGAHLRGVGDHLHAGGGAGSTTSRGRKVQAPVTLSRLTA